MPRQAPPTNTEGFPFLIRLYAAESVEECKDIYEEYCETFDTDQTPAGLDYQAPGVIAEAVKAAGGDLSGEILDAGCGTGLSGKALMNAGAKTIDGVDLSPGMLSVARKTGAYRRLATADLTKEIPEVHDASYDVVTCVGTLTYAHVGPTPALREFVRITRSGGIIGASVLDDLWETGGFEAEVERLKQEQLVEVISTKRGVYRRGVDARILVMKRR